MRKNDIKNPDNDKQDWENFLNNKEKIPNKDFVYKKNIRYEKIKKIEWLIHVLDKDTQSARDASPRPKQVLKQQP